MSHELTPARRRRGPSVSAPVVGLTITALVMALLVAFAPGAEFQSVRRLVGLGPDHPAIDLHVEPGTGSFAFLQTQPGSGEPVGYDPCRSVPYAVNPAGAPDGWQDLIEASVAHTEAATGLSFDYVGTTAERPFSPTRGGPLAEGRSPAVVGFASSEEIADLGGDVAGLGGSRAAGNALGRRYYVTGSIALDTDVFDDRRMVERRASLQAMVDHEFGHLVGLDHVADPGELMYEHNVGRTGYGPGDLEGLARLGAIPCG